MGKEPIGRSRSTASASDPQRVRARHPAVKYNMTSSRSATPATVGRGKARYSTFVYGARAGSAAHGVGRQSRL